MEFPYLGKHCSHSSCNQLDFLPMKCDACDKIFCKEHVLYRQHHCEASYKKDVQVPVCPLCNKPVPGKRGEQPDLSVGEHIDRDCQSDPAKQNRKIYTNKCSLKGCKQKELVKVLCSSCHQNYCLKHRHTQDHNCSGASLSRTAAFSGVQESNSVLKTRYDSNCSADPSFLNTIIQGNLSEDEAIARAIQVSLQTANTNNSLISQEEQDRILAEALAASEIDNSRQRKPQSSQSKDKCNVS